jgi:UDP-glucose 4-epimerase
VRVLLTGATGFVGSHVLRKLLADGRHNVAVLLRHTSRTWRIRDVIGRTVRIEADLTEPEPAYAPLTNFAPDTVVHLAWSGVGNPFRNDQTQIDNIPATVALLRLAHRVGAKHWVGLGSQAEYGPCDRPIDEDTPTRPTTLYGVAKLSSGLIAQHLCGQLGLRFAWLRLFSCYGPGDDPAWMLPYLILTLRAGKKPALTAGEQLWDYLYVTDAAEAICQVALTPTASGAFNLGSGRAAPIRTIVERVRDLIDPQLPLGFGEVPYRPDQVMRLEANITRLRDATGWSPQIDLDEGLRRTVEWFRERSLTR